MNGNYGLILAVALFLALGIVNAISRANGPDQAFTTEIVAVDPFSDIELK